MSRFVRCNTYQIIIQAWKKFEIIEKKGKSYLSYNQLIHFRYQNSMRRLKLVFEKYNRDLDQQVTSTNNLKQELKVILAQFPARSAFLVQHRTKVFEKRQPQTSESRDHCRGKVRTYQFAIQVRNTNYILEFRDVFRTQSNIYDGAFSLTLNFTDKKIPPK